MNTRRAFRLILFLLTLSSGVTLVSALHAAETVDVVIGPQAHRLTKFAADELAGQFTRLFGVEATVSSKVSASSSAIVCVGGPQDNPLIAKQLAKSWPKASNQGLVMESFKIDGKPALAVGGGSPRATLWAVYELGHRYGIRYLLREDIYPAAQPLNVAGIHVYQEPQFRDRTWRTVNDFAHGPESWGVADHQKLLRQLAKLKFNRVMLSVYPWQPFVHYELDGVAKQTGVLWYGERYRVNDDIPARTIFGGREFFENADFAEAATYDQRRAAGEAHLRGIIGAAHELGMSVGLSISPLEFPKEFSQVLPGAEKTHGLNGLVIAPSGQQGQHDKQLREMVRTKIRAYLETYPQLDALYLSLPEFPEWDAHAAASWSKLATRVDGAPQLGDLLRRAEQRPLIASGNRGRVAIQGNIVSLTFLRDLLAADRDLLRRADGKSLELRITAIDPDLLPYRKQLAPAGSHALNFIDYTARRIDLNSQYLAKADAKDGKHSLYMTLADDNVGVLPQSNVRRIDRLTRRIRELGWHGFATRYWDLAELDPAVVYLSRAAYDPKVTARSAHDELFATITGKQAASDRLWLAFGHMEKATELLDEHQLGFAFPVKGMMMKHYQAEPLPKWFDEVNEEYTNAMIELYRSHDASHPRARPRLFYWAKRSEYVSTYLATVKSVRDAAAAEKAGDVEKAIEHMETAIESLYNTIDTLGDVAQNPSDHGLVAVLAEHAYRPLIAKYEKLLEDE